MNLRGIELLTLSLSDTYKPRISRNEGNCSERATYNGIEVEVG
jgi:hypothetical protein